MNHRMKHRCSPRFRPVPIILGAVLLIGLTVSALARDGSGVRRSIDRDNPAPLSSKEFSDELDGSDGEYFYIFQANPGKLTITLEVQASATNAGAVLDLFDTKSKAVMVNMLAQGVNRESERVKESVQLERRQPIVMRIQGIKYGSSGGRGRFTVLLDGPISFVLETPIGSDVERSEKVVRLASADSNSLTGELDGTDRERFYCLIAGPGTVTITFDVRAAASNAGAFFALFDEKAKSILESVLVQGVDGGTDRIVKTMSLKSRQVVRLRVKGVRYGSSGGGGTYAVRFDGPAKLK